MDGHLRYDSNNWRANTGNITAATVDANYQSLIQMGTRISFRLRQSRISNTNHPRKNSSSRVQTGLILQRLENRDHQHMHGIKRQRVGGVIPVKGIKVELDE